MGEPQRSENKSEMLSTERKEGPQGADAAQETDSRRAEEALFALAAIVESSNDAIIGKTLEGIITSWNKGAERIYGYKSEDIIGQSISTIMPPEVRAELPRILQMIGRGESVEHYETVRVKKDGQRIHISLTVSPIKDQEGRIIGASAVARDITEHEQSKERLRKSEERLQTIIENLNEGLVVSDLEGNLLHWNRAALEMHGFKSVEEGLHALPKFESIFELSTLDGAVLSVEQWPLPRIYRGERLRDFEVRIRRFGTDWERIFRYGGSIVYDPDGTPLAVVTISDISERKWVEEALRRNEEQLRLALAATKLGTWDLVPETGERNWSERCKAIYGLPADARIDAETIFERIHPEDRDYVYSSLKRALEPGGSGELNIEYRVLGGRDTGLRWVEAKGRAFFEEGRAVRITGTLLDITERKGAEEKLREQARILDLAPVLVRNLSDHIIMWNTGAELMYGWTQEEALGQMTHSLFQTTLPQPIEEIEDLLYAHGSWKGELVHIRRDGGQLVIDSQWVLHRDKQGRAKAILEVNNDITERRRAEEEVRRLNEELEERVADRTAQLQAANRELEAFSYSVSHDLRAPLRHINGFSQALMEDYADELDEVAKGYLQEVRAASQEMAQLIDDVLELARVTRTEMRREPVDISRLAQDVVADLHKREPGREVSVSIEEGLTAEGDKRLLRIVLVNLLGNAWKFTSKREGAEISFGRTAGEGENAYYVRDNGAGFDMAYADKLFGAFQRLHASSDFEGTGIGLATVMRVVSRHGGRVWAEGAVDQGASFYFTLPRPGEIKK